MSKKTKKHKSADSRLLAGEQRRLKNLEKGKATQFRKGVSGNPDGRPKFAELSKACRHVLSEPMPSDPSKTWAQGIALALAKAALKGSVSAASELANRAEGLPRQALEITNRADPLDELIKLMEKESEKIGPPPGMVPRMVDDGEAEETIN